MIYRGIRNDFLWYPRWETMRKAIEPGFTILLKWHSTIAMYYSARLRL